MKEEKRSRLEEDRITNSCITRIGQSGKKQKKTKNKTKQESKHEYNL